MSNTINNQEKEKKNECEHKFVFRGLHVEGKDVSYTVVPHKTLYEVYFCEKCLETKQKFINQGLHIKTPEGASTSGYGL